MPAAWIDIALPAMGVACLSITLGCLPLPRWIAWGVARLDLARLGTGNLSVSAAFKQVGVRAGVAVVLGEIGRGVLPVLMAQWSLPEVHAAPLLALFGVSVSRFWFAHGGSVTNCAWGMLFVAPSVVVNSALTGLAVLGAGRLGIKVFRSTNAEEINTLVNVWAARVGCGSGIVWMALVARSGAEVLVAITLAGWLLMVNLWQGNDAMALRSLASKLKSRRDGAKAARLAAMLQEGMPVPMGWVVLPQRQDWQAITKAVNPSPEQPVIARSSAVGEDSVTSSAAGQYRSSGVIESAEQLQAAIEDCRASYLEEGAIAYREQQRVKKGQMSVLVQQYVKGKVSGVAFSRHPLDGAPVFVVETLAGGAESVVGGDRTPEHLEIERSLVESSSTSAGKQNLPTSEYLPQGILRELLELLLKIERLFEEQPQDVEWVWDGEQLWIVQARPISTLSPVWTRTIAAEVIPGAIHPLTWSINRPLTCGVWGKIFRVVLGDRGKGIDFNQTATLLGSHAYFNASLLGQIFRMMGLPEQGLEFLLRGQKMGKPPLASTVKNLPGLMRLVGREGQVMKDFQRDYDAIYQPVLADLDSSDLDTLTPAELVDRVHQLRQLLQSATYYNILGPIGLAIRKSLFKIPDAWLKDCAPPELASLRSLAQIGSQLREAAPNNANSDQLATHLEQSPKIQAAFQDWLTTYGYLSEAGTDISVPTWRDRPEPLLQMLLTFAQPSNRSTNSEDKSSAPRSPVDRWRVKQVLPTAQTQAKIAEVYAKMMAHLRWTFLALEAHGMGVGAFQESGDIFYLTLEEVERWVAGESAPESLGSVIAQRRSQLETDRDRQVPSVVYGNRLPLERKHSTQASSNGHLQGIPASAGTVEGIVKICRKLPSEGLAANTILVVPYTDAGWAPVLVNAAAIVAEVGGQLSHGAIVAREFGIPAVMNVEDVMSRLQDGDRVQVDGDRGLVHVVSS